MLDAFVSLSTSTSSDRAAVADLTVTNSNLAANCTVTHALLVTALQDVETFQASVANLKRQLSTTSSACSPRHHCCWTCFQRCDHIRKRCPNPSSGHQYDATHAERKGGIIKRYKYATRYGQGTTKVNLVSNNISITTLVTDYSPHQAISLAPQLPIPIWSPPLMESSLASLMVPP